MQTLQFLDIRQYYQLVFCPGGCHINQFFIIFQPVISSLISLLGDCQRKKHNIFFDRQKEWQLYCEYFKKTYGKMLEKEGEEFWKRYFEWCEIADEEREKVDELRKELGV